MSFEDAHTHEQKICSVKMFFIMVSLHAMYAVCREQGHKHRLISIDIHISVDIHISIDIHISMDRY